MKERNGDREVRRRVTKIKTRKGRNRPQIDSPSLILLHSSVDGRDKMTIKCQD